MSEKPQTPRTDNYLENLSQSQLQGRDAFECIESFARTLESELSTSAIREAGLRGALEGLYNTGCVQDSLDEIPECDVSRRDRLAINRAAAALASAPADGWRGIQSVPLKTDVLLYWPPKMGRTLRPAQVTVGQVHCLAHYAGATHWQPLPPAPEGKPNGTTV